jgi:hypothetical protein
MCVKRSRQLSQHPGTIASDSSLSEFVEFEIPSFEDATRLCMRLGLDWFTWVQVYDNVRLVVVMLVPDADDLGALLRTVQGWGRQHGLPDAISFALDGRRYVLDTQDSSIAGMAA